MRLSMIGERPDKDYSITSKQRWKWWEANVGKMISKGNFEFWEHLWQLAGLAQKQSVPTDKVFPFVNVYHCVSHCHYVHHFVHHCVCGSWCASLSLCASHGQWPCVLSGELLINKLLSHKGDLSLSIPSTFICTICSHSHFYLQLFVWSFLYIFHAYLPFSILTSMLGSFIV